MSDAKPELPAEFAALLETYVEMFGVRPTLPEARSSADVLSCATSLAPKLTTIALLADVVRSPCLWVGPLEQVIQGTCYRLFIQVRAQLAESQSMAAADRPR